MAQPVPIEKRLIDGPAGAIEVAVHTPVSHSPVAIAVVSHPHPLFGGTMDNKVVTTMARAMLDAGATVWRYNFRGVGQTAGTHDDGRGETEDLLTVIAAARADASGATPLPLWLGGFSFGGAVTLAATEHVACDSLTLVAPAFQRMSHWQNVITGGKPPPATLLIHGENDETVPLADSIAWAAERDLAVALVPRADHFFHLRLHILKRLVARHLQAGGG
jgi:alpha/beta superfamily hydrolase